MFVPSTLDQRKRERVIKMKEKIISVEKMSKKARREYFSKQRETWTFSPVTRVAPKPSAYCRAKQKIEKMMGDWQ